MSLSVEEFRPSRWQGSKEERILAILEPRYTNKQIWHPRSGNIQILEEELVFANPSHDDVKDSLSSAIEMAQMMAPKNFYRQLKEGISALQFNTRFGGIA